MILIDSRVGSKEFKKLIPNSKLIELEFGDFAFHGHGPDGIVEVGIERKTVSEIVASATGDKRLVGRQIPGLKESYDHYYIIVEGQVRCGQNGLLQLWKGKWMSPMPQSMMYRTYMCHLLTIQNVTGVPVVATPDKNSTVGVVSALSWWYEKEWDRHSSGQGLWLGDTAALVTPTTKRKIASLLPGVGWKKSITVDRHFSSIKEMVNADVEEWQKIEGIGMGIANKIINEIGECQCLR